MRLHDLKLYRPTIRYLFVVFYGKSQLVLIMLEMRKKHQKIGALYPFRMFEAPIMSIHIYTFFIRCPFFCWDGISDALLHLLRPVWFLAHTVCNSPALHRGYICLESYYSAAVSGSLQTSIHSRERDTSNNSSGVNSAAEFEEPQAGNTDTNLFIDSSQ